MAGHSTLRCSHCRRVSASATGHPDNIGMSLMGHLRQFDRAPLTSGLPLLADIFRARRYDSKVPTHEELSVSNARPRGAQEQRSRRGVVDRCRKSDGARKSRIAGLPFEQNLNGTRSEIEHAELLLAYPVGRVDRLRLAEIGDRLGAAAQRFMGEAAVVVGLDIGRTELDRLREICNRAVAVTLCDVEVLGVYRDRLVIVPDRVIDLAQRSIG